MRILAPFLAVMALAGGSANAASLFVRPTTVVFAPGSSAATVTVSNRGTSPITAQLRLFGWDQGDNEDKLNATSVVAASPPMVTIAAGGSQTVRLVRTAKTAATSQENYRLLVDEIVDRRSPAAASGIQIQLRYSVPVFVLVNTREAANLSTTVQVAGGNLNFEALNRGKAHAQISTVSVKYADGSSRALVPGLLGYVLPEKQRRWSWVLPAIPVQPTQVRAVVNGQELLLNL